MIRCTSIARGLIALLSAGLFLSSCSANAAEDPERAAYTDRCPVYEAENWHAWIDQVVPTQRNGRLVVTGQVTLPNPGYQTEIAPGPLDRRQPPALRLRLVAMPPSDSTIQVIETRQLEFAMPTNVLNYREIIIICGDRILASIPDVVPTD